MCDPKEKFVITSAKAFKREGIFKGRVVNLDGHLTSYFGDLKLVKDKHPTRNILMRGIKAFSIQDQDTGNPVFDRVEYPRTGLKPGSVAISMLEIARDILPDLEKVVFEEIIEFPALVKAMDDRIVVTFYGNYKEKHKMAVESLLRKLDESGRNLPVSIMAGK